MSLIDQEFMALIYDDMGEPTVYDRADLAKDRQVDEAELEAEMRVWELSQYSTEELQAELDKRETEVQEIPIMKGTLEMLHNIRIDL